MNEWVRGVLTDWRDLIGGLLPIVLLAALGGIVRAMQCGKAGLRAVGMAALSAAFAGLLVHLLLSESGLPAGVRAAIVGVSGYASGELLKILMVRVCRKIETLIPK